VNYLGDNMPTFALNFSRPGAQVVAQYYNFIRLGFEGYREVQGYAREVATRLSGKIGELGPFELITKGDELPVFAFKLRDEIANYTAFDVSNALRERGWQVPARWEIRRASRGEEPLVRPGLLRNRQLSGGLIMFFFQYLVQAGLFFVVPLLLSVCLGLSALETGARLLPLSVTLLLAAIGIPRLFPDVSPRLVVRGGLFALLAGTVVLLGALDADAGAEIVFVPMLLVGLGIGALASQLGSVTVSAVPDDQSPEVGGVQNTMTNLGASMGTALAGSIMIAAVTTSFLANIQQNPAVPPEAKSRAQVELAGGVPFVSNADLRAGLEEAGASSAASDAALEDYADARIDGLRSALAILAALALGALFFTQRIPSTQPGTAASALTDVPLRS
jgi:Major Facilitator Superfamily/Pyridoxal-dependent decarboxylase conserved domain